MINKSQFFDLSSELFCVVDVVKQQFVDVNSSFCELLEHTHEELTSKPYWEFMLEEDENKTLNCLSYKSITERSKERESSPFINRYKSKSGKTKYLEWGKSVQLGSSDLWCSVARDITEQVEDIGNKHILKSILDTPLVGYWDYNIQDNTEYYSPSFKKMLGYKDDEFPNVPESWMQAIHPEDLHLMLSDFETHIKTDAQEPIYRQVRYYHKDGSILHVLCRGSVIAWDHENKPIRAVGSHINVTDSVNNNIKYEKLNNELVRRREELSMLLSVLSHDLRAPLSHIYGFISLLKEELGENMSEEHLDWVNRTLRSCNYATSIVEDVHTLSKISKADTYEDIDLNEAVDEILQRLHIIGKKDVRILIGNLPIIRANRFCVIHSISNVLHNSMKFKRKEAPCEIHIMPFRKQGIVIEDNGIGVRPEHLESIFEMFNTVAPKEYEGTGAGLGIVKKAIELHNGHVWAENVDPTGLRVVLDFNNV